MPKLGNNCGNNLTQTPPKIMFSQMHGLLFPDLGLNANVVTRG